MSEQPTMSKKSFEVDYQVQIGRPYELCGAKVVLCFTVVVKFDKIKTKTAAEATTTTDGAFCKPTISFDGVIKTTIY